jgi:hypothetical protein
VTLIRKMLVVAALFLQCGCCSYSRSGDATLRSCVPFEGVNGARDCRVYMPWIDLRRSGVHQIKLDRLPPMQFFSMAVELDGRCDGCVVSVRVKTSKGIWLNYDHVTVQDIRSFWQSLPYAEWFALPNSMSRHSPELSTIEVEVVTPAASGSLRLFAFGGTGYESQLLE